MKSPIVLLQSLLEDFSRLEPDVKGLDRDLFTIKNRFESEGYGFLAVALPNLCKAFDRGLATGRFTCPEGFKKIPGGAIPRLFSGMLCEIFESVSGLRKESVPFGTIINLRQIMMLFKKTQMSDATNILLEQKAVSGFYSTDVQCGSHIIEDREWHLLGLVSKAVLPNLNSEVLAIADYKHGPGAVYEGLTVNKKWSAVVEGIKNDAFDIDSTGYVDFGVELTKTNERALIMELENRLPSMRRASIGSARLISVPKNSTSRRTITIEPVLNQFVQQGLNTVLREEIKRCTVLSNCLALTDQSKNQQLALEGSQFDNWATIDLKSASDLLSVQLVERVFDCHGLFFDHMMDCRSPSIEYAKKRTNLRKFAGMGNALTFPVQSICFAVVCIAAIIDSMGRRPTHRLAEHASRCIRIFGDDIIVKKEYAHQVVNWLTRVGLKVNVDKSFLEGNFKESCGVDAYMGVDVTPTYLRHRPDTTSTEPNAIESIVAASNQLWLKGYYMASTVLKDEVEERLGHSLPLVPTRSEAIGWHTRQDVSTFTRVSRTLHRPELRALVLAPVKRRDKLDGYAALLKFFHTPLLGRPVDHLEKTSIRYKAKLKWKWVAA